jgi:hypothetical protein
VVVFPVEAVEAAAVEAAEPAKKLTF